MNIKSQKVLITGSAGFIGFFISQKLLLEEHCVLGVDNFNSYYDLNLKKQRHKILKKNKSFTEIIGNIEENKFIEKILIEYKPNYIIHLAAQAGVRYSLEKPDDYLNSNIIGTYKILNALKKTKLNIFFLLQPLQYMVIHTIFLIMRTLEQIFRYLFMQQQRNLVK